MVSIFKPGDRVRFLNDTGKGTVTRIVNKDLVMVKNEDDWEIPVMVGELIPDYGNWYPSDQHEVDMSSKVTSVSQPERKKSGVKKEVEEPAAEDPDIKYFEPKTIEELTEGQTKALFALVPHTGKNPSDADLEAFLINDSPYHLLYNYIVMYDGSFIGREAGILDPDTKLLLEVFRRNHLNELTAVSFQLIFTSTGICIPNDPISKTIQLNMTRFYKETSFRENEFFDEPAIIYQICSDLEMSAGLIDPAQLAQALSEKKIIRKTTAKPVEKADPWVIDLHIHEILPEEAEHPNARLLEAQLDKFHSVLKEAIGERIKRVVFIHGVGNGILKQEIRKQIEKTYRFECQDASFAEYGYGATLVHIRFQSVKPFRYHKKK
jgi:hypothetical protein